MAVAAAATSSTRTCCAVRERALTCRLVNWCVRSELSWQPDNDLDDELKPKPEPAERDECQPARRTASIRHFIVCLLSVTVCYSPFTIYHLPLPFAIALCGFACVCLTNSRRRPIDSLQMSPESLVCLLSTGNSISEDLHSATT